MRGSYHHRACRVLHEQPKLITGLFTTPADELSDQYLRAKEDPEPGGCGWPGGGNRSPPLVRARILPAVAGVTK
jgi:hypothetical protein